ncbi:hypothetical protein NOVOSPHI9U_260037 [Novosphingobium sp. 9U]|nr:hypothetical protein NOVOSPHI9U_260037 [Novosphingobium sp. 9U]
MLTTSGAISHSFEARSVQLHSPQPAADSGAAAPRAASTLPSLIGDRLSKGETNKRPHTCDQLFVSSRTRSRCEACFPAFDDAPRWPGGGLPRVPAFQTIADEIRTPVPCQSFRQEARPNTFGAATDFQMGVMRISETRVRRSPPSLC